MQNSYTTPRLQLRELTLNDTEFIKELVNTDAWIKYIGDRNIKSNEDATTYVEKIIDNPGINYLVVRIQEGHIPIGIITFIKRDYLEHHDIGFAFLPGYAKQGYAYEATVAVLNDIINDSVHTHVLATTVRDNTSSIQLLKKLGLRFSHEMEREDEILHVYDVATDKLKIDRLTKMFFRVFSNKNQRQPGWDIIHTLCLPETIIIKKTGEAEEVYNLDSFIEPRKKILQDGTLTEFEESETYEETTIAGNIAQRFSKYEKSGYLNGKHFNGHGNKFFQFIKTHSGWKINSLVWEDD